MQMQFIINMHPGRRHEMLPRESGPIRKLVCASHMLHKVICSCAQSAVKALEYVQNTMPHAERHEFPHVQTGGTGSV
jgi:hypothetical protein